MKNSEINLSAKNVNAVISHMTKSKFYTAANEANESFKNSKMAILENASIFGKAVGALRDDMLSETAKALKDKDGNPKPVESLSNIEKAPIVTAISKHFGYSKDYLNDLITFSEHFKEVISISKKHEMFGAKETEIYGVTFPTPETITLRKGIQIARKLKAGVSIQEINDFLSGKLDEKKQKEKYNDNLRKAKTEVNEAIEAIWTDLKKEGVLSDDKIRTKVLSIFQDHIYPLIADKYGLKI
jgi:DNA-binding transcriptional MerR regulator